MFSESLRHLRHLRQITDQDHSAQPVIEEIIFSILTLAHILEFYPLIQELRILPVIAGSKERRIHSVECERCCSRLIFQLFSSRIGSCRLSLIHSFRPDREIGPSVLGSVTACIDVLKICLHPLIDDHRPVCVQSDALRQSDIRTHAC